jgi:ribonuclease-3
MTQNAFPSDWLAAKLGHRPDDETLFARALTHPSMDMPDYQRLEFLGDRVLGLAISNWLFELHGDDAEGKLNSRLAALVSKDACAEIGRELGLGKHITMGKQARDDGAADSDNVLGDVVEALIGALYRDAGFEVADAFVRDVWAAKIEAVARAPHHPKSALQEWAAANRTKPPVYAVVNRSGPQHNPQFRVRAEIPNRTFAEAEGSSKQEAETAAAEALLEQLQ